MNKKSLHEKLRFALLKFLPIQKNTVLFQSFSGQYSDNPKAISEKLHELRPETNIVWVVSDRSSKIDFPDYVKTVDYFSFAYDFYASTARVVIDNMTGIRAFRQDRPKRYRSFFLKRKGQTNYSTFHGTPLKHIGNDEPDGGNCYQSSTEFISTGNEHTFRCFQTAFRGICIEKLGSPRNDIFFNDFDPARLKQKLGLPADKKILLYAPTYRNNLNDSGLNQIEQLQSLPLHRLLEAFESKYGGEWVLVLRLHYMVLEKLKAKCGNLIDQILVFDGNAHDDMMEYLACCDALLTDYSSSMFDLMLTDTPCYLFAEDRAHYVSQERGVYMKIEDLPFPFADSLDELLTLILTKDYDTMTRDKNKYLNDFLGNFEDGHASERFVSRIIDLLG